VEDLRGAVARLAQGGHQHFENIEGESC